MGFFAVVCEKCKKVYYDSCDWMECEKCDILLCDNCNQDDIKETDKGDVKCKKCSK